MSRYLATWVAATLVLTSVSVAGAADAWEQARRLTRTTAASTTSINFARSVAADAAGSVHVAWVEQGTGPAELFYKRSIDAGVTWGPPIRLLGNPNQAFYPSIAASDGQVIVAWQDTRPGGTRIYARRSSDGGIHWQGAVRITNEEAGSPSVAYEGATVHLVYGRPTGPNDIDVFYRRSDDHGATWSAEIRISDLPGNSWVPTVAASGSHVYVAWSDTTHSPEPCCLEEEYFAHSSDGGRSFGPPVRLTVDPPGALANSWAPSLAADGDDVWIVWFDQRSGRWEIYFKRSQDHGLTWSPDVQLTQALGSALRPSIAQRESELYVAYWDNPPGEAEEIFLLRSSDRGVTWQPPLGLSSAPGSSTLASIAAGEHGVHVVWSDARDGNPEVYYARLPGTAVAIGNGLIAYNRIVDGLPQLFTANPDGSGERQLTFEGSNIFPAWSKDGSRLLFTSGRDGADKLWVMEPDGSNQTPLSIPIPGGNGDFVGDWSYDGTRIAFTSMRGGSPQVWIMNADATGAVLLTESSTGLHPSFAPGDTVIYYASHASGSAQIWGMLPDGRGKEQKTSDLGPEFPDANVPEWSRNGVVVFWAGIEDNHGEVWTLDLSTNEGPRRLTTTPNPRNSDDPTWSPDGSTILFNQNLGGKDTSIYAMNADGSNLRSLLAGALGQSAWQPIAASALAGDRGLTGFWYEPATNGQGFAFEVYPDVPGFSDGYLFGGWFTFDSVAGDASAQRWYSVGAPIEALAASQALTIYRNVGGNFAAGPVTTAQAVGSATLSFDHCGSGSLDYSFDDHSGPSGRIDLIRLTPNQTCSTTAEAPVDADFDLSGFWHDPLTSGQGVFIEINNAGATAVMAWYTYAPNGQGSGASGQRWYTAQGTYVAGTRTVPLSLHETTGGVFDAPSTPPPAIVSVGQATLTFSDCTHATLAYAFTGGSSGGRSGNIALERVGPAPSGCRRETPFGTPKRVSIRGYDGDAMEPFLTRDGRYLLFNNLNSPAVDTNLHYAERVDDLTFDYRGELTGANSSALDGVPSVDRDGRFYFVSTRSYNTTSSTIYAGHFVDGSVSDVMIAPGISLGMPGRVNFDVEVSPDGRQLYFVDSQFGSNGPQSADIVIADRVGDGFVRRPDSAAILANVNTDALEYAVAISEDGLEILFTRAERSALGSLQSPRIFHALRSRRDDPFDAATRIDALDGFVEAATFTADERAIYFHKLVDGRFAIFRSER